MMNRLGTFLIGILVAGFMLTGIGDANTGSKKGDVVEIRIDISSQTMAVDVNGWPYGRWKVSTAILGTAFVPTSLQFEKQRPFVGEVVEPSQQAKRVQQPRLEDSPRNLDVQWAV